MENYKTAWFINFNGIGNGIMVSPILKCFEDSFPNLKYYHTENVILANKEFKKSINLNNLVGFTSLNWRRFEKKYWEEIGLFIKRKNINLIINLRNEGPDYDKNYYEFKKIFEKRGLIFWDLDFKEIKKRKIQQSIVKDTLFMLKKRGVNIENYDPNWLPESKIHKNIGLGINASQDNKKWPASKWVELCGLLVGSYTGKIILFSGTTKEDLIKAKKIKTSINSNKIEIVHNKSLNYVSKELAKLECFVSNDTGLLHMAYATNIPLIGIYTSTNPKIWAPYGPKKIFSHINRFANLCSSRKKHCGNCSHYYEPCPAIAKYGDDISSKQVFSSIKKILGNKIIN